MIFIKHILDQVNYSNDENNIVRGLSELADLGVFNEEKLHIIKRAMIKRNVNEMTEAEKKTLQESLSILIDNLTEKKEDHLSKLDTKRKADYPSEKDMPAIIVLKRKAIRVFPDNQKVGLYYSQALDKYVSIPFGKKSKNMAVDMNEENRISITDISPKKEKEEKVDANSLTQKDFDGLSSRNKRSAAAEMDPEKRVATKGATSQAIGVALRHRQYGVATGVALHYGANKAKNALVNTAKKVFVRKQKPTPSNSIKGKGPVQQSSSSYGMFGESKDTFRKKIEEKRQQKQMDEALHAVPAVMNAVSGLSKGLAAARTLAMTKGTPVAQKVIANLKNGTMDKAVSKAESVADKAKTKVKEKGEGFIKGAYEKGKSLAKGAIAVGAGVLMGVAAGGGNSSDDSTETSPGSTPTKTKGEYSTMGQNLKGVTVGAPRRVGLDSGDVTAAKQWNRLGTIGTGRSAQPFNEDLNNFNKIRILSEKKNEKTSLLFEKTNIQVNSTIAKKILNLHESLNKRNRIKLEKMINEDASSIRKIINFAVRQQ